MTGGVRIDPARGTPGEAAVFARLLEASRGRPLAGAPARAEALARRLFLAPASGQSAACTWFASVGEGVAGLAIAYPSSEYEARRAETRRLESAVLPVRSRVARAVVRAGRALRRSRLGPVEEGTAFLEALAVFPPYRRQGLARALFRHVCVHAREQGLRALELDVDSFNHGAVGFYRAQGCRVALRRGRLLKLTVDLAAHDPA